MSLFLFFAAFANCFIALTFLVFGRKWSRYIYDEGRKDGFKSGYDKGRKDEADWYMKAEQEVGEEREKIWREEE